MRKNKMIRKFMLVCLISSYLQVLPAFSRPVLAQEAPDEICVSGEIEHTCVVAAEKGHCSVGSRECLPDGSWSECVQTYFPETEDCDNELDDDCDGFEDANDPDCQIADLELGQPVIEISADQGILKYKLLNEAEYEGLEIAKKVEWFEKVQIENGSYQYGFLSSENEYLPQNSGVFAIKFTISMQTEQGEISSSAESEFAVTFPVIDESQFQALNYRAGERFTLKYFDESGEITNLTGKIEEKNIDVKKIKNTNFWKFEGEEITTSGDYQLFLSAESDGGFKTEYAMTFTVFPGTVDAASSKFEIVQNGAEVEYLPTNSGIVNIRFTAYDEYLNGITVSNLDRVDIRFNGELLEGVDLKSANKFVVERALAVPKQEDLNASVTVDVFDSECEGILFVDNQNLENYCFGRTKNLVIYDEYVSAVNNLEYLEKTKESSVIISGEKEAGYGIKINSTGAGFIINPDDKTTFSFSVPLAEGINSIKIYAVKVVTEELTFYSEPVAAVVEKDTKISPPVWNDPAITLDGDNQATLHWTDPIYLSNTDFDFSHVNIYRSTVPNFVPGAENLVVQTHNPSWTDTGLIAGVKYYYLIEAVDNVGNTAMINKIQTTNTITGDSTDTESAGDNWYDNLFAGKGDYDEGYGENEEVLSGENTEETGKETGVDQEAVSDVPAADQEAGEETEESWLNNFFKKAGDSMSSLYDRLGNNIFVQICCGGVIIFVTLMILISVLVWLKEKFIDKSSVANLITDSAKNSESKKSGNKNKSKKKRKK